MFSKPSRCRKVPFFGAVCVWLSLSLGCQLTTNGLATTSKPTKVQSRLVEDILKSGGHFDIEAGADPLKIQTVYLPKDSLNKIRPTSLAVLPNLKAVMIIEGQGEEKTELTGFLVERPDDLLASECGYQEAGWIQ